MSIQSEITRIINKRDLSFVAIESKGVAVPTDATIDDLPDLIAAIVQSGATAGVIVDTLDSGGGIIREITTVDLSSDTVTSNALASGVTAHDRWGNSVVGTLVIPSYEVWTGGSYGS